MLHCCPQTMAQCSGGSSQERIVSAAELFGVEAGTITALDPKDEPVYFCSSLEILTLIDLLDLPNKKQKKTISHKDSLDVLKGLYADVTALTHVELLPLL